MGVQTAPGFISQNVDLSPFEHPVELMRNLNKGLFDRSGVLRYGDFAITTPGSGLVLNVAAGEAFLLGAESNTQGGYFIWSNAAETVNFAAPSGSIRHDTVLLRVRDPQYGTITGNARASIEVVSGVAGAGAPRADSYFNSGGGGYEPGAWLRLADVQIDPAVTSIASNKITSHLRYVRTPGGKTLCTSTTRPTDPIIGDEIYETNTQLTLMWNGSLWLPQYGLDVRSVERGSDLARVNTTTLADDGVIQFSGLPANAKYKFEMFLAYAGSTTGDFKVGWTVPAGGSMRWNVGGLESSQTSINGADYHGVNTEAGTDTLAGTGAANKLHAKPWGWLKTGSGGDFKFRWAQGAIDAVSGSTCFTETTLIITRIG